MGAWVRSRWGEGGGRGGDYVELILHQKDLMGRKAVCPLPWASLNKQHEALGTAPSGSAYVERW